MIFASISHRIGTYIYVHIRSPLSVGRVSLLRPINIDSVAVAADKPRTHTHTLTLAYIHMDRLDEQVYLSVQPASISFSIATVAMATTRTINKGNILCEQRSATATINIFALWYYIRVVFLFFAFFEISAKYIFSFQIDCEWALGIGK